MQSPSITLIGIPPHQMKIIRNYVEAHYGSHYYQDVPASKIADCSVILLYHDPQIFNGLERLRLLRQLKPGIPVVMLGLPPAQHDIVEAFRQGARDFLFFPLEPEILLNCLFRLMEKPAQKSSWLSKLLPGFLADFFSKPLSEVPQLGFSSHPMASPANMPLVTTKAPDLQVNLLGYLSVLFHGKELPRLPGKKAKELLAFILCQYPKPLHRDVLIDRFWSDSMTDSARNCLNVTLHAIRKNFTEIAPGEEIIVYHDECYGLNPELTVERDVDLFEQYWKKGRRIELENGMEAAIDTYHQAFAFYRGDFLEEFPYQDWTERERDKFKETWLVILDRLSAHFFEKGRYQICLNLCKKILEKDDCLEEAHRRLMECYAQLGMREMAIRQYQKCKLSLSDELSVAPGKATFELYEKIRET